MSVNMCHCRERGLDGIHPAHRSRCRKGSLVEHAVADVPHVEKLLNFFNHKNEQTGRIITKAFELPPTPTGSRVKDAAGAISFVSQRQSIADGLDELASIRGSSRAGYRKLAGG